MEKPAVVDPVVVSIYVDHTGPSSTAYQQEEIIDAHPSDLSYGIIIHFTSFQSTSSERAQSVSEVMLNGLMAKLEKELAKAAEYTELAWLWDRTFNS